MNKKEPKSIMESMKEFQRQLLLSENNRLLKAVERWKEEEKMWKEFNTKLEEEICRLREVLDIHHKIRVAMDGNYSEQNSLRIRTEQALRSEESDEITSSSSIQ